MVIPTQYRSAPSCSPEVVSREHSHFSWTAWLAVSEPSPLHCNTTTPMSRRHASFGSIHRQPFLTPSHGSSPMLHSATTTLVTRNSEVPDSSLFVDLCFPLFNAPPPGFVCIMLALFSPSSVVATARLCTQNVYFSFLEMYYPFLMFSPVCPSKILR